MAGPLGTSCMLGLACILVSMVPDADGREPIRYTTPGSPHVHQMPVIRGQRYEDMVPDTVGIDARIELAINGLTARADPEAGYEIYFWADFFRNPPVFIHNFDSWCQ